MQRGFSSPPLLLIQFFRSPPLPSKIAAPTPTPPISRSDFSRSSELLDHPRAVRQLHDRPMAPRRRPKKVGLKREDAAIDHVADLGFTRTIIRKTLKELLKEYGGEQGWFFIEEGSYKLLIEKILDEEEKLGKEMVEEEKLEEIGVPDTGSRTLEDRDEEHFGTALELQIPHSAEQYGAEISCGSESTAPLKRRPPICGWVSEDEDVFETDHSLSAIAEQKGHVVVPLRTRTRPRGWDVLPQACKP